MSIREHEERLSHLNERLEMQNEKLISIVLSLGGKHPGGDTKAPFAKDATPGGLVLGLHEQAARYERAIDMFCAVSNMLNDQVNGSLVAVAERPGLMRGLNTVSELERAYKEGRI